MHVVGGHAQQWKYGARWGRVESGEAAGRRKWHGLRGGAPGREIVCPRCSRLLNAEPQDVKVGDGARRRGRRKHCVRRGARAVFNGVIGVVVAFVNNAGAVGAGGAAAAAAAVARSAVAAAVVAAIKGGVIIVVGFGVAVAVVALGVAVAGAVEIVHTKKTALEVGKSIIQGREGGDCLQPNRVMRATKVI
jgi:hypothetical protein